MNTKKTGKHRSPKFPFIKLEQAIASIPTLIELESSNNLDRENLAKGLGFESLSGPAARTIAALRAYYLIKKSHSGPVTTEVCRRLAENPADLEAIQIAALSPLAFRGIWRNARNASEEELKELLISRNFTSEGADKAVETYLSNAEFAKLDQVDIEPPLPERGNPGSGAIEARLRKKFRREKRREDATTLKLPLKNGHLHLSGKLAADEFDLVIETLHKWRSKITDQQ